MLEQATLETEPFSTSKAISLQKVWADQVVCKDDFTAIKHIGGMDVSNSPYDPSKMVYASAILMDFPNLTLKEEQGVAEKQTIPYIPGLLGFRETPSLIKAYQKLEIKPDLILVDGHGISHPRGLGIASQLGVVLDIPTIGVAKSILIGKMQGTLGEAAGSQAPLVWKDQIIGMLLRTKVNCLPLIISVGHRVSLETAINIVKKCLTKYRLPLPTRQAHLTSNSVRRKG